MIVLSLVGVVLLYLRYRSKMKIIYFKNDYYSGRAEKIKIWVPFIIDTIIFSFQELPNVNYSGRLFNLNGVINCFSYLKVYFLLRIIIHLSKFATEKFHRICMTVGITPTKGLTFKLELKQKPFMILAFLLLLSILISGIMI